MTSGTTVFYSLLPCVVSSAQVPYTAQYCPWLPNNHYHEQQFGMGTSSSETNLPWFYIYLLNISIFEPHLQSRIIAASFPLYLATCQSRIVANLHSKLVLFFWSILPLNLKSCFSRGPLYKQSKIFLAPNTYLVLSNMYILFVFCQTI